MIQGGIKNSFIIFCSSFTSSAQPPAKQFRTAAGTGGFAADALTVQFRLTGRAGQLRGRSCRFSRIEGFYLCDFKAAAAVFAFQLSYLSVKTQRPRTRRALVNCDLLCHVHPPFRCRLLIRSAPLSYIKEGRTATCCTPAVNINSLSHRGRLKAWEFRTHRRTCPCCLCGRT